MFRGQVSSDLCPRPIHFSLGTWEDGSPLGAFDVPREDESIKLMRDENDQDSKVSLNKFKEHRVSVTHDNEGS